MQVPSGTSMYVVRWISKNKQILDRKPGTQIRLQPLRLCRLW